MVDSIYHIPEEFCSSITSNSGYLVWSPNHSNARLQLNLEAAPTLWGGVLFILFEAFVQLKRFITGSPGFDFFHSPQCRGQFRVGKLVQDKQTSPHDFTLVRVETCL